jgi:hypothetical protein
VVAASLAMKKIYVVTMSQLTISVRDVERELERFGFWDEKLASVEVYLVPLGYAYGWQYYGGDGSICIPAMSLCKLGDLLVHRYSSLRGVVRHEFAHAFADTHSKLITNRKFTNAFGADHDVETSMPYDPESHVTFYSSKNSSEDFAEVFSLYLKHNGRLPERLRTKTITKKWRFIKWLGRENAGKENGK